MHKHTAGNGGYFPELKFEQDGSIRAQGHAVKDSDSSTKPGQFLENMANALASSEVNKVLGNKQ